MLFGFCSACAPLSHRALKDKLYYRVAAGSAGAATRLGASFLDPFLAQFERIFDRPNYAGYTGDRLFTIWQGMRLVADYAVEFSILSAESGWNKLALLCAFCRGLNVRDALILGAMPKDLPEMVDRAIELDNHQREQLSLPGFSHPPAQLRFSQLHVESPTTETNSPSEGEEYMQLRGAHLSTVERSRGFATDSCLYCGHSGHFIASCPSRPKGRAR